MGSKGNLKMRLATEIQGDETPTLTPARSESPSPWNPTQRHEIHSEISESRPLESTEYFAIAARATNDAVRDWNVKTGALSWPQGLKALLGYDNTTASGDIGFWQKQIHPQDRARTAGSIRDTLATKSDRWTGEYRFRHVDGSYLDLLERALIVRDSTGSAVRFVGSLQKSGGTGQPPITHPVESARRF
jgi:PAS domain-containing protein